MIANNQHIDSPNRTGLFGGSFNPIHRGHIEVVGEVLKQYDLDQIHFIPSAIPPHKAERVMAPAIHRLAMVRLALQGRRRMHVSDIEIQRSGKSYTIDTLRWFKTSDAGRAGRYYFIIGIDAFLEIHTWKAYFRLFDETAFIIMPRPATGQPDDDFSGTVERYVHQRISGRYQLSADGRTMKHPELYPLHLAQVAPVHIASTQIRKAVRQERRIDRWVDCSVARYIAEKGLYR